MYILLAILLLAILIVVHEGGHFWAARATGIQVSEFSVGFGPKLIGWKSRKHETTFAIRAVPLGGYCAFYGEDDTSGVSRDDPRCFYWANGVTVATGVDPVIAEVMAAGPAHSAGLQSGDRIAEINGKNMLDGTMETLLESISEWQEKDGPMNLTVQRGEEILHLTLTPVWDEQEQKMRIGVMIGGTYRTEQQAVGFAGAAQSAWELCVNASGAILRSLKDLVTKGEGLDQTAGPVGIVSMVSSEVREGGFSAFVQLLALISINLGLMNLLPIPGLDGSRLVFCLLELIRRKPIPPEKEAMVHLAGMVLLFGVLIFFTFKDVMRLFGR